MCFLFETANYNYVVVFYIFQSGFDRFAYSVLPRQTFGCLAVKENPEIKKLFLFSLD